MKKKLTTSDLKQYILAEVKKLHRIEVLKEEKSRINKELKMLNENSVNDNNLDMIYNLAQNWANNGNNWTVEYQGDDKKNNAERFTFTMYFSDKKNKGPYLVFFLSAGRWDEFNDEEDGHIYFNISQPGVVYNNGSDDSEYNELGNETELFPDNMTQIVKGEIEEFLADQGDHHEDDHDDRDDDYDSGMSSSQQAHADRSDYAREKVERGDWDETQADEFRMGA